MEKLKKQLDDLIGRLNNPEEFQQRIINVPSAYPFSKYEYIISHLLAEKKLDVAEYYELRKDYIDRNRYLHLFEISAPRRFGEKWAQDHLQELVPHLQRPNQRLDPHYVGQYDFFMEPNIRVEVKASRAVEYNTDAPIYLKALSSDSTKQFDMNFQQIKTYCCDVFVWLAVWRDVIMYWVIPSFQVEKNQFYSKGQHRGNSGEGQLHLNRENIHSFDAFLVDDKGVEDGIISAFREEKHFRSFN